VVYFWQAEGSLTITHSRRTPLVQTFAQNTSFVSDEKAHFSNRQSAVVEILAVTSGCSAVVSIQRGVHSQPCRLIIAQIEVDK